MCRRSYRPRVIALLRSLVVSALSLAFIALGSLSAAHADAVLDQSISPYPGEGYGTLEATYQYAQVFTAGKTGFMTKVGVGVRRASEASTDTLTVQIYSVTGSPDSSLPDSALPGAVGSASNVPEERTMLVVDLDSPVAVTEGTQYAIVLSTTGSGEFNWWMADGSYLGGHVTYKPDSEPWGVDWADHWFETYVDDSSGGSSSGAATATKPMPQTLTLALSTSDDTQCSPTSMRASEGTWVTLPAADACAAPAGRSGITLLGWATSPDFSVDIAQRQVTNGWGTYETFDAAGNLSGVFIPAGRSSMVTQSTTLFAIWGWSA